MNTIYIKRYNNGERNFSDEVTIFNEYELEEILTEKETLYIYAALADNLKAQNDEFEDLQCVCDITRIYVQPDIKQFLYKLKNELLTQSVTVSGDDDSYDYFPDLVYAFAQICKQLKQVDYYNDIIKQLNRILDYNEDDENYIVSMKS